VDVSSLIGSTHGLACQFLCFYVHWRNSSRRMDNSFPFTCWTFP
jgi:hypothetical protein